jgi:hypothetical protein
MLAPYSSARLAPNTLKETIFQGSPWTLADATSTAVPAMLSSRPMAWVRLLITSSIRG